MNSIFSSRLCDSFGPWRARVTTAAITALFVITQSIILLETAPAKILADEPKVDPKRLGNRFNVIETVQTDHALSIALSNDGKQLVAGGFGKSVRVWDTESRELLHEIDGSKTAVRAVAFHPTKKSIAAASGIEVYCSDLRFRHTISFDRKLEQPPGECTSLAFSPDGKQLAGCAFELIDRKAFCVICVWNLETGRLLYRSPSAAYLGNGVVAFSPDGRWLAAPYFKITKDPHSRPIKNSEREDGIRFWSTDTRDQSKIFRNERGGTYSVDFSPDGKLVLSSGGYFADEDDNAISKSMKGEVVIWDFETGAVKQRLSRQELAGSVHARFSPNGELVVGQHYGRAFQIPNGSAVLSEVTLWDVKSGDQVWSVADAHAGDPQPPVFSPDGKYIYVRDDRAIRKLDVKNGDLVENMVEARPIKD